MVYLVGAGPGIAELITVRGLELVRRCNVIIYDRLAGEELLSEVPEACKKIYVGKQPGHHSMTQEEINELLIECADSYETVVRLKGGDPFVFGRGDEELAALCEAGISCEVIPGISSCIAVPELAHIPVTMRGTARGFAVITGYAEGYTPDYEHLAVFQGTLVFLMGLAKLGEITEDLILYGKPSDTPAAVIQLKESEYRLRKNLSVVRGTLKTIVKQVIEAGLQSPVVIVVGETAACHFTKAENRSPVDSGTEKNCTGQELAVQEGSIRIGITATPSLASRLLPKLSEKNIHAAWMCEMQVVKTKEYEELCQMAESIPEYDWVVFTSENGIRLFFEAIRERVDYRSLAGLRFAVIGAGTAEALRKQGFSADAMPEDYTVEALADLLQSILPDTERVLIVRARQGSRILTDILTQCGVTYTERKIYDVQGKITTDIEQLEKLDYLLFASSSGAHAFYEGLTETQFMEAKKLPVITIGKETAKAVIQCGGTVVGIADRHDTDGLVELLLSAGSEQGRLRAKYSEPTPSSEIQCEQSHSGKVQ